VKSVGHRLAMARALQKVGRRSDHASRALATALRTTALDLIPRDERQCIGRIEARRREVVRLEDSRSPEELEVGDLAAAVEWMSVPPVLGRFLMRFVRELAPGSCLELGTGFGISAAYQAAALELNGAGTLITIDVSETWAGVASEGLSALGFDRVEVRVGDPDRALAGALADAGPVDYAFVDSDHQEAATVDTLQTMLPHLSWGAVVVFDDVGFSSPEMDRAWTAVRSEPRVSLAVRFARLGVTVLEGQEGS
jgi:predicted O-methyltransferase YrrM